MEPSTPRPAAPATDVTRVVIASESRITESVMEELFVVRARFLAADDSKEVHAAVLYASQWFVIWVEGPDDGVDAVLKRSAKDKRHAHLRIIHRIRGPRTLPERLTLASTQGADRPFEFARRIHAVENASPALQPATIWRRLSAPWTLGDPSDISAPPCRRLAVMGSDENRAIDAVRRLAERFRGQLVYQRFAGGQRHSRDVGGAYLDLPIPGRETRVHVISRRALELRMVREPLEKSRSLALLVGDRPGPAIELAESVAALANRGASLPAIQVVAHSAEVGGSVGDLLRGVIRRALAPQVVHLGPSQVADYLLSLTEIEPQACC